MSNDERRRGPTVSDPDLRLARPPIVEAVLDIDCDMPPAQEITALEAPAREAFRDHYPKFRTQYLHQTQIKQPVNRPPYVSARHGIQAYQLLQDDEKQLVQVRVQGFSFNRLAPYTGLDDYLPEIERTWRLFVRTASPVQVRLIRLRYVNRLMLPMGEDGVELDDYLRIGPRIPDERALRLRGFLNQQSMTEAATGNQVNVVLANQEWEERQLPLIVDIAAIREEAGDPEDWGWILAQIESLRGLKNRVFRGTLTERCMELFR